MLKKTGIALIIIGVLLAVFTGFSFFTKKEVVDIGQLEITKDKKHTVNWPPYVGAGVIIVGGIMVFAGRNQN